MGYVPSWLKPLRRGKTRRMHYVPMRTGFKDRLSELSWNWHWSMRYGAITALGKRSFRKTDSTNKNGS